MVKTFSLIENGRLTLIYGVKGQYCSLLGLKIAFKSAHLGKVFLIDMARHLDNIPMEVFSSDRSVLEKIFTVQWDLLEADSGIVEIFWILKQDFNLLGLLGLTESYIRELSTEQYGKDEVLRLNKIMSWVMGFLKYYSRTFNIPVFVTCEVEKLNGEVRPAANILRYWPDIRVWIEKYESNSFHVRVKSNSFEEEIKLPAEG